MYMNLNSHFNICRKSFVSAFILGLLTSAMFGLAFYAGHQQGEQQLTTQAARYQEEQIVLHSKVHLVEMKMDVISEQKDTAELQNDFDRVMTVLEQSHAVTGEGIIARDEAMRAAADEINQAIAEGGQVLVDAIEELIELMEDYLYPAEETDDGTVY